MLMVRKIASAPVLLRAFACVAAFCAATTSTAATFTGEFWSATSGFRNINQAINFANTTTAAATFESTGIDYQLPTGTSSLADFLGPDAATLSGSGDASLTDSVFRISGSVDLLPSVQEFATASDFGFRLLIEGQQVSQVNRPRGLRTTTSNANPGAGEGTFELFFYDRNGGTRLAVFIDGQVAEASPIPLPAGLWLISTALAALGLLKWRRRTTFALGKPA